MSNSDVGGSTIVGGSDKPRSLHSEKPMYNRVPSTSKGSPTHQQKGAMPPIAANFVTSADYMDTERAFFVRIGKDGLLGALQKLDRQLQNSGRGHLLSKKVRRCRVRLLADGALTLRVESDRLDWVGDQAGSGWAG